MAEHPVKVVVTGSIPVPAGGMEGWPKGKGAYKIILSGLPKPFTAIYLIIQEGYVFVCSNHTPSTNSKLCRKQKWGIIMGFMDNLKNVLLERKAVTENGALGYASTGKALVDLNFAVASLRNESEEEIVKKFVKAYYEDKVLAMQWLFFLRDIRGGLGERRSFRIIFNYLASGERKMMERLLPLVAEYGRFDDLLCLLGTPMEENVLGLIKKQVNSDMEAMLKKEQVSLCAKWLPSINASSAETRNTAKKVAKYFGITAKEYRQMLAGLREYLKVTEVLVSSGRWDSIVYEHVPSNANLLYRNAFMKHDGERRQAYLDGLVKDKAKINAATLMPHEIVLSYTVMQSRWSLRMGAYDETLELLWKNLDDTVQGAENVLCVVDGSGSMTCNVGNSSLTALHVSNALGIYFAERLKGPYKDKFITFSSKPEYVDLGSCNSLKEKLELAFSHDDCTNTNIKSTFDLVLQTAVENNLAQEELPGTILIISDMEFDYAVTCKDRETLFENIHKQFKAHGYKLPRLVFWNCNSRTGAIPVKVNELGVGLVSGFSVNVCKMVLSGRLDPYSCLREQLDSKRYEPVRAAVQGI